MSLENLVQFAVSNNNSRGAGATPIHKLSVEDARSRIIIRDGNKTKKEGSQALVLGCGRRVLPLDIIKKGSTRLNVEDAQVEAVTEQLQAAIDEGAFDEAIKEAQEALANPAPAKTAKEETAEEAAPEVAPAVDGLDLDDI
jgi:hypothetical protein